MKKTVLCSNVVIFLLALFAHEIQSLSFKELDDIFEGIECIEGDFSTTDEPGNNKEAVKTNIILTKHKGIKLTDNQGDSSFLLQVKQNVQQSKSSLSLVYELAQLNQISIEYILVDELGEPHAKTFWVQLNLGEETYKGTGKTIKAAKQQAAQYAINNTKYIKPEVKTNEQIAHEMQHLTPTVHLNNIAAKLGIEVKYFTDSHKDIFIDHSDKYLYYSLDSSSRKLKGKLNNTLNTVLKSPDVENQANHGPFRVRVDVGDETFIGTGWTIQSARHHAAEEALEKFRKMSLKDAEECLKAGQLCNKLNTKSPISLVHEIAQKNQWDVSFDMISETGPAHKRLFTIRCKLADLTTEGDGNSKKAAKAVAAEAMLKLLKNVQPWDLINVQNNNDLTKKKKKKNKKNKITRPGIIDQTKINVLDALSAVISTNDNENVDDTTQNNGKRPKDDLLDMGNEIGINIRFSSYQNDDTAQFGSLVTLGTNPTYHCYAKDDTSFSAEDNAALYAIQFLKVVGLNFVQVPMKMQDTEDMVFVSSEKDKIVPVNSLQS